MEQTALRPKPLPGAEPAGGSSRERSPSGTGERRPGRRFAGALCGLCAGLVLLLAGVGLGAVGATVIGASRLAEAQRHAGLAGPAAAPSVPASGAGPGAGSGPEGAAAVRSAPVPGGPTLGVEAVDDGKPGARVVGVHVPGPGYSAGLVRGDVLLVFDRTRIDSAADLARAVAKADPGRSVVLTVRHRGGGYQQLDVTPGVVT
ncbi:PDZ domain-containing protein [Streptomyces sp. PsTaAH-124]|uniref:PDZ domain-containing protein n=1 Tax=Streptomyces sp. PsTaAH-124 TaxID=1157638 RepID=UPI00035D2BFD|nr:PDZ domain-containing protein [Streptomyces sp. PsTaAH-124]